MMDEKKRLEQIEEDEAAEVLVAVAAENQTRKILALLEKCHDLEEAKAKVKALLPEG